MASPFSQAWEILKYFKNPHDEEAGVNQDSFRETYPNYDLKNLFANRRRQPTEEETYGGISHREHPLHNVKQEREMAEMDDPLMAEDSVDAIEMPPLARNRYKQSIGHEGLNFRPPDPFKGERGSINTDMNNQAIEEYLRDMGMMGEEDESVTAGKGDMGRPGTIPMSPRGSKRGRGEQQAFDKPEERIFFNK